MILVIISHSSFSLGKAGVLLTVSYMPAFFFATRYTMKNFILVYFISVLCAVIVGSILVVYFQKAGKNILFSITYN